MIVIYPCQRLNRHLNKNMMQMLEYFYTSYYSA